MDGTDDSVVVVCGTAADVDAVVGSLGVKPVKVEMPPLEGSVDVGTVELVSVALVCGTVEVSPVAAAGMAFSVGATVDGSADLETPEAAAGTAAVSEVLVGTVSPVLAGDGDLSLLKSPKMEVRLDLVRFISEVSVGEVVVEEWVAGDEVEAAVVDGAVVALLSAIADSVTGSSFFF